MRSHLQSEIAKLKGPAQALAQLISDISMRVFGSEWNTDIEWYVRDAMDNGSYTIRNVDPKADPGAGKLTQSEISQLQQLRKALNDGWVHLEGLQLRHHGPQPLGSLRYVTAQDWKATIGTDEYRSKRYDVI